MPGPTAFTDVPVAATDIVAVWPDVIVGYTATAAVLVWLLVERGVKVLGVEPVDEQAKARFSNLVHWGYGTGWGAVRGLLASAGLCGPVATAAHLGLVWGAEQVVLPALDVSAPVFKYGSKATATDLLHHVVYATATGLAYSYLDRSQSRPS